MASNKWDRPLRFDTDWKDRHTDHRNLKPDGIEERRRIELMHGAQHDGIQPILEPPPKPTVDTQGNVVKERARPASHYHHRR